MDKAIDSYLSDQFGTLKVPDDPNERFIMARTLLGYSLVGRLDYWFDFAIDKITNASPAQPYVRENDLSRKDKSLREAFVHMDDQSKKAIKELVSTTITGLLFSILVDFDQFDFGELSLVLKTKSAEAVSIEISSPEEELHNDLSEWLFLYSKHRNQFVEREQSELGISYRIK